MTDDELDREAAWKPWASRLEASLRPDDEADGREAAAEKDREPLDPDAARRLFGYRSEIADIFRGRPLVLDRPIVMQIPWAPV